MKQAIFDKGDLPWNEEAERLVLGCVMRDGLKVMGACAGLRAEHFYLSDNQQVWQACIGILAKQADIGIDLVWNRLGKDFEVAYLASLTEGIYTGLDPSHRVAEVIEAWKQRRGIEICNANMAAFVNRVPAAERLSAMQAEILDVLQESSDHDNPHVSAYADEIFDSLVEASHAGTSQGLTYGDEYLDYWTSGMQMGEVTVVGARSGVGKSSLMKQATVPNCKSGNGVVLFSLEMSRKQIFNGLYAILTGIEYRRIKRPHLLRAEDRERIRRANEEIKKWPLWIYDKAEIKLSQIVAYARMHIQRDDVKLVCVDYAQNVDAEGRDERSKVSAVSRKLTQMVKDEKAHLMLLSQLRKPDSRSAGQPPTAADLRESGQLENDAHTILLLHRPWDDQTGRLSLDGSLIIPKGRDNPTGTAAATFQAVDLTFRFREQEVHA